MKEPAQLATEAPADKCRRTRASRKRNRLRELLNIWLDRYGFYAHRLQSAFDIRARALLLQGDERASGQALTAFYFGVENNLDYLLDRTFARHEVAREWRGAKVWHLKSWMRDHGSAADLLLADVSWPYHRLLSGEEFLTLQSWVQQTLPMSGDWETVRRRFYRDVKNDLRRLRKYGLEPRISSDPAEKAAFYDEMYVPFMTRRHGKLAFIEPRARIDHHCREGQLLQAIRNGRVIASGIVYEWNNCLSLLWCGMPAEVEGPLANGAFGALYYFAIRLAYEQGFDEVNFNYSRPLLNDGPFRFKRKWGGRVCSSGHSDYLLIKATRLNEAVESFFANNPLISCQGRRLTGHVLLTGEPATQHAVAKLATSNWIDGLDRLRMASSKGFDFDPVSAVNDIQLPIELLDLSRLPDPASSICR